MKRNERNTVLFEELKRKTGHDLLSKNRKVSRNYIRYTMKPFLCFTTPFTFHSNQLIKI